MADQHREFEDCRRDGRRPEVAGERGERGGDPGDRSFGGQRPYARDLYSDTGMRRHDTDGESGSIASS